MTGTVPTRGMARLAKLAMPLILLAGLGGPAWGRHVSQHEIADGLDIYIGLLSAPMVERFGMEREERRMHGGPSDQRRYHLVAAVFESGSGQRIEHADVKASVAPMGLAGETKHLEPMKIQGAATFGRTFDLPDPGRYAVTVTVKRTHDAPPVAAQFTIAVE